jgi:hypothetical protein
MATRIKGYRLKDGRIEKDPRRLDVSARLRQRNSKKVTVKRKTAQSPILSHGTTCSPCLRLDCPHKAPNPSNCLDHNCLWGRMSGR